MKYKSLFILILLFFLFSSANAQKFNETLRQELLTMETEDQTARIECTKISNAEEQIKCLAKISETVDNRPLA